MLSAALTSKGFKLGAVSALEGSFVFTKLRNDGLFELIDCDFAGRYRDAAVCQVGVSVTRIVLLKKLTEESVVVEVATVPERGWTIIESDDQLEAWVQKVIEIAVPKAEQFANEHAESLLVLTETTRRKVQPCIDEILRVNDLDLYVRSLKSQASSDQIRVAKRLADWPGVLQVEGAEQIYEAACLAVVTRIRPSELPNPDLPAVMPLENAQLMWEIQLIADRLLDHAARK